MALSSSMFTIQTPLKVRFFLDSQFLHQNPFLSFSISTPKPNPTRPILLISQATRSQTNKRSSSSSSSSSSTSTSANNNKNKNKKRSKTGGGGGDKLKDFNLRDDFEIVKAEVDDTVPASFTSNSKPNSSASTSLSYHPTTPLPKPPAGFLLDEAGRVLMASTNRIATIVDPSNNYPLDCVIRRVFTSSRGDQCMLLCPVDTPVQILKSINIDGWSAVSDEEVEAILPAAAYALAKIHMHLVHSGFCYTARGGFCYSEDDIFDFRTDNGEDVDGLPTEGVEITCFHLDGAHYMIYTPSDPLLFVAVKDSNGQLQIADDDLLEDPAILSAVDEETEFNALVEEEAALLESLMGER